MASSSGVGSASCSSGGSGRAPSDVWKFFEKKKEAKKAKCTVCGKELAFHGGTSNLRDHLLKMHPLSYQKPQRGSIDTFLKPRQCSEARIKEITERIASILALDLRPLRTVEWAKLCNVNYISTKVRRSSKASQRSPEG